MRLTSQPSGATFKAQIERRKVGDGDRWSEPPPATFAMIPADYHTHTALCHHAAGMPVDYAMAAKAKGLDEMGCADHNPSPGLGDDWRMGPDDLSRYLEGVAEAMEWADREGGPVIRLGMEADWFPGQEKWLDRLREAAPWDYWIGSVHYLADGWDVDNPRHLSRIDDHGVEETWDLYWKLYREAILTRRFEIMGHPDLVKKFGHRPGGDLRRYYEPVVEAMADADVAFELNTAGWRKSCAEPYPHGDFLEMAALAGVPVVLSSDAHAPGEVADRFEKGMALLRQSGFSHHARFHRGRRKLVPFPQEV